MRYLSGLVTKVFLKAWNQRFIWIGQSLNLYSRRRSLLSRLLLPICNLPVTSDIPGTKKIHSRGVGGVGGHLKSQLDSVSNMYISAIKFYQNQSDPAGRKQSVRRGAVRGGPFSSPAACGQQSPVKDVVKVEVQWHSSQSNKSLVIRVICKACVNTLLRVVHHIKLYKVC